MCARESSQTSRGVVGALRGPIPDAGPDAVQHGVHAQIAQGARQGRLVQRATGSGREHPRVGVGQLAGVIEDLEGSAGQRHTVLASVLHALGGSRPDRAVAVGLVPRASRTSPERARSARGTRTRTGCPGTRRVAGGVVDAQPLASAHFMTAPMRCRTRLAVTRLVDQMGDRTAMTSAVVTASTVLSPIRGKALVPRVARHWCPEPLRSFQWRLGSR